MIPRLKRQTKKRHSVQREGVFSRITARRIAAAIMADLSEPVETVTLPPIRNIIGARLTPDVWAP